MTGIRLPKMYPMQKMKMHYDEVIQVKEMYRGGKSCLMVGDILICQDCFCVPQNIIYL